MADYGRELREASAAFDLERTMLRVARSAPPHEAARAIESYLTDPKWATRQTAAFAFSFIAGSAPDALVAALGDSSVSALVLAAGGATVSLEDHVRDAAAYALASQGDPRSIPRLVCMLRHQDPLHSRRFRGGDDDAFSTAAALVAPSVASDVQTGHVRGPAVERLLLSLGAPAETFLGRSLNWGGFMNELLCGPLMLADRTPANATEEFFYFLIDRRLTREERRSRLENGEALQSFDARDIAPTTLVRSLISHAYDHDPHVRIAIAPLVCEGVVPLWQQLTHPSVYTARERAALRGCLSNMLRRKVHRSRMSHATATRIQEALQ